MGGHKNKHLLCHTCNPDASQFGYIQGQSVKTSQHHSNQEAVIFTDITQSLST